VGIAALVAVTLAVSHGLRAQGPEYKPPRIAFVDMDRVIEKYVRAIEVEQGLKEKAEKLQLDFDKQMRDIKQREADLEVTLSEDSKLYAQKKQELAEEAFRLQYQRKWMQDQIVAEARDEMAAIYKAIEDAVARYSEQTGLEAVLVVARGDLPGATVPEVRLQIKVRPVIYCADHLEITEPVLAMLNAEANR
jgi:Skp family chaperone for outer membrane proteins